MTSCVLRLKCLGLLSARFSKYEVLYSYRDFQRTLHTDCLLLSNVTKQFLIHDLRDASQSTKNPDFGRVVDLDCSFDDLKVDEEQHTVRVRSKKKRNTQKDIRAMREFKPQGRAKKATEFDEWTNENDTESELDEELKPEENNDEKQNFKILKNPEAFGGIMLQVKSKKLRNKKNQIILEGKRLIRDAILAGHKPLNIFFSCFSVLRTLNLPEDVAVTQVSYKALNTWSDVATSQGVIGIFKMPDLNKECKNAIPLTVICDNIKDPGNLGTILRVCSAIGCQELILTVGCVDIWEPKVLRAGVGAHFRLCIKKNFSWSDLESKVPEGTQIILADNKIPIDSSEVSETDTEQEASQISKSAFKTFSEMANSLPICCYSSFEFDTNGAVIILGGETHGLSDSAYDFAKKRNGSRVYLPMCNGIESLNSAVVLGIFSYEFKRQLMCKIGENSPEQTTSNSDSEIKNLD